MACLRGHGTEGVGTAGGEGVHTDQQHVHQQGPGVAVRQEAQRGAQDAETPQEVPTKNRKEKRKKKVFHPDFFFLFFKFEVCEDIRAQKFFKVLV